MAFQWLTPEAVRSRCPEVPVHLVTRAWRGCVWYGRTHHLAASNTLKALILHQPFDRAARHIKAFALHLPPDFLGPVDGVVLIEHPLDLRPQDSIALDTWRDCLGMVTLCDVVVICRWGNRQNSANRLDTIEITMVVDEGNHRLNGRSSSACAKYAEGFRRISLAWRSSLTSRSSSLIRSRSSLVDPDRLPLLRSACATQLCSVCGEHPILTEIDTMAAHCEA